MLMQTEPPEPEYFFGLFVAVAVFFVCAAITIILFGLGRRWNSKALKIISAVPVGISMVLFVPTIRMFWIWVSYWLLGNR
jgi:hypothetical protein